MDTTSFIDHVSTSRSYLYVLQSRFALNVFNFNSIQCSCFFPPPTTLLLLHSDKAAIRTVNNQFNSESTMGRSQSTGLGTCNGLSSEIGPGVWFAVQGTGSQIKATTCNAATEFKATLLVYSGSTEDCNRNSLTCVAASDGTDFECSQAQTRSTSVEWRSLNGLTYYILVQPQIQGDGGTVWMKFRTVSTVSFTTL